jgi:hypothetical protein
MSNIFFADFARPDAGSFACKTWQMRRCRSRHAGRRGAALSAASPTLASTRSAVLAEAWRDYAGFDIGPQ